MDKPARLMAHTGHRRRRVKNVMRALVDLLFFQSSTCDRVRARSKAVLSLVLRETSDLRKQQEEYEDLHVRPTDPEVAAVQKALGLKPPSLVDEPDLEFERTEAKSMAELTSALDQDAAEWLGRG
jgi:hypothetical protein